MRKSFILILFVITLLLPFSQVYATEDTSISQEMINNKEILIQNKINEFIDSQGKSDINYLSVQEEIELVKIIEEYKYTINNNEYSINGVIESGIYASTADIGGYIFSSLDSRTSGWNHGHAGIGYSSGGNVIEANPNVGVKLYSNRVEEYWGNCQTGGIYWVNGASSSQYTIAKNYAYSKLGCDYNFNALDTNSFYCSELVYYAWDAAGYNIASSRVWGTLILPSQIMNDGDTVLGVTFPLS